MTTPAPTLETLAATCKTARFALDRVKARYYAKAATYDEMAEAGKAFCAAFDAYHRARYGKPKRLDYRAIIR